MRDTTRPNRVGTISMSRFRYALPPILWAVCIFIFSTTLFTSDNTSRFIIPLLHFLFPSASMATLEWMHHLIRKGGHLSEYFVLCILVFQWLRGGRSGWNWKWALCAVAIAAAYACTDEFHQIFVPGRTASPWDVLIDTCGAALAQVVLFLMSLGGRRKTAGLTTE
jgi:VanZ family protein